MYARTHVSKSVEWKGEILGILEMRRHYTNYLKGLPHIKEFRTRLVTVKTLQEVLSPSWMKWLYILPVKHLHIAPFS